MRFSLPAPAAPTSWPASWKRSFVPMMKVRSPVWCALSRCSASMRCSSCRTSRAISTPRGAFWVWNGASRTRRREPGMSITCRMASARGGPGTGAGAATGQGAGRTGGLSTAEAPGGSPPGEGPNPAAESLSAPGAAGGETPNRIRILANRRNNALVVYATPSEYSVIEGMLRKMDIIPLQVLIEATIAEVTLNDTLNYGTQFYLGSKFAGTLTTASSVNSSSTTTAGSLTQKVFSVGGTPTT